MGMTENKRFGMIKTQFNGLHVPIDEWNHFIFSSCESELDCMRIVNALNSLHEKAMSNGRIASELLNAKEQLEKENKELKQQLDSLQTKKNLSSIHTHKKITGLMEANKELKQSISDWQGSYDELYEENKQYENEIARLQLINKKLKDKDYTNYKEKIQELQGENKELKVTTMEMEDYLARMEEENKKLREQLKDCTKKAKEEIRKQAENDAIRWANIGR